MKTATEYESPVIVIVKAESADIITLSNRAEFAEDVNMTADWNNG